MTSIQHFLLVFDHARGRLIETREFGTDSARATEEYAVAEKLYADEPAIEIVLIGADSFETVKLTHANYFGGTASVSKYLAGI